MYLRGHSDMGPEVLVVCRCPGGTEYSYSYSYSPEVCVRVFVWLYGLYRLWPRAGARSRRIIPLSIGTGDHAGDSAHSAVSGVRPPPGACGGAIELAAGAGGEVCVPCVVCAAPVWFTFL